VRTVCLSGGVFQNRRLAQDLLRDLAAAGFEPFINRRVPVNDGGVSYGQAVIGAARLAAEAGSAPAIAPGVGG
jgi:hydrogenase maturation protein HypF